MKWHHTRWVRKAFRVFLWLFAGIGFIFVGVYFALQLGLLNVKGSISQRNSYFDFLKSKTAANSVSNSDLTIVCKINTLTTYAPLTSINIYKTSVSGGSDALLAQMIDAASRRFEGNQMFQQDMNACNTTSDATLTAPTTAFAWADTDEWSVMKDVFTRDQDVIKKAAADSGVSPRLLLTGVIGEQFRFFTSEREVFKSYFEPLKILASLSNTSYGIAGLKPKTVGQIEDNLKNPQSPFYPGPQYEDSADHDPSIDIDTDRMNRITDTKDPYYSYLYVGLYMKEIETQWKNAGYDLSDRPDVLATLYNLGFYYSVPKTDPQAGGAIITVGDTTYTFGDLGYEFYYSGELSDIFPLTVQ